MGKGTANSKKCDTGTCTVIWVIVAAISWGCSFPLIAQSNWVASLPQGTCLFGNLNRVRFVTHDSAVDSWTTLSVYTNATVGTSMIAVDIEFPPPPQLLYVQTRSSVQIYASSLKGEVPCYI